jgi:hypothetical protein
MVKIAVVVVKECRVGGKLKEVSSRGCIEFAPQAPVSPRRLERYRYKVWEFCRRIEESYDP